MRVLHILPGCKSNNIENYAAGVILELQKTGIEQCVAIDRRSPYSVRFEQSGIKVLPRLFHAPGWPLRRLWLAGWIAHMRPALAHCWTRSAVRLVPSGKLPVVSWLAGYDGSRHLTRCTHVVSASRVSAARLAKKVGAGAPARFIPAFPELPEAPSFDRHRLATPRDAKVIASLAPLHPASRIDLILAALKNLPGCILWLGGEGPCRSVVEKSAIEHGMIDRIRFAAPRTNPFALLRAADLCVTAAAERPFDMLVPKAWAAGTPVVAVHRPGFHLPLENDVTGLLAPIGDDAALAHAIRQVLDDGALRRRLIAKGYATYHSTYAREAVVRQWVEFYKGIRGQGSGVRD